jgi:hypothetical protein
MNINGNHIYVSDAFLNGPNHTRVMRLLREMDLITHPDRRSASGSNSHGDPRPRGARRPIERRVAATQGQHLIQRLLSLA